MKKELIDKKYKKLLSLDSMILNSYICIARRCYDMMRCEISEEQRTAVQEYQRQIDKWLENYHSISKLINEKKKDDEETLNTNLTNASDLDVLSFDDVKIPDSYKVTKKLMEECRYDVIDEDVAPEFVMVFVKNVVEFEYIASLCFKALIDCRKSDRWQDVGNMWQTAKDSIPTDARNKVFDAFGCVDATMDEEWRDDVNNDIYIKKELHWEKCLKFCGIDIFKYSFHLER